MIIPEFLKMTFGNLKQLILEGYNHWIIAYSGGKDSSALVIAAVEAIRMEKMDARLDVIYSDTLVEIPPLRKQVDAFLTHLNKLAQEKLPIQTHVVTPVPKESFWTLLLGKGYPPPGPHFRWCMERLKFRPMHRKVKELATSQSIVLTGVRWGESQARDRNLKRIAACPRDGECGQGLFLRKATGGVKGAAPLLGWRTCWVWDFLAIWAPALGWPTSTLQKLYGQNEAVRFGCWVCSLVKDDKALEASIAFSSDGMKPRLQALKEFRNLMISVGRNKARRILRPDGRPGPMDLKAREELLQALLNLEEKTGFSLLTEEEKKLIKQHWEETRNEA